MKKVLLLAYVFPPFFSVGGSIRAVKFVKYLPERGWRPLVLTIDDRQETVSQRREGSAALLNEIPSQAVIYRTTSGEPAANIQQKGREIRQKNRLAAVGINFLSWLRRLAYRYALLPDAGITWLPAALRLARRIVRDEAVDVIWATCPLHSTAVIAACLKHLTHRPLIVDYRDDWIDTPWFRNKPGFVRWIERRLESWVVRTADRIVLVTPASRDAFRARYPRQPADKFRLIANGCDLEDFAAVRQMDVAVDNTFRIVHTGLLSIDAGWHRSPEPFFAALRQIGRDFPELARHLQVTFTGRLPQFYSQHIQANGLKGMVQETGFLPHNDFLRLLRQADLLLAINYEGFHTLIPGKMYEYWAVGRAPILLLDGPGAAQSLLRQYELGRCVPPDDVDAITQAILSAYQAWAAGRPLRINPTGIEQFDRQTLTSQLADLLDELTELQSARAQDGKSA